MRRLIESFLAARALVMPPPRRPPLAILPDAPAGEGAGGEESQELYDFMDIDLADPELLAALGDPDPAADARRANDKDVVEASPLCECLHAVC